MTGAPFQLSPIVAAGFREPAAEGVPQLAPASRSITSERRKAWALAGVAVALAATDPDRAGRAARSITSERRKAPALVKIAEAWSQG